MKLTLLTVGKTDMSWVKEGLEMYRSRLVHYIPFSVTEIPELKGTASLSPAQIKEKEGEKILAALKPSDDVILLDEHGKKYRSLEFAAFLEKKMAGSGKDIVFIIGGAYGFSAKVYERASSMLSLSDMTFSHQMVRTVFAEQLYRAFTIMRGEPYHNE
ncbi:MAG: 23S rRNA (pseudouridine(1915)-N(3))-methyltransferase RlmH [Bacteroidales bacterium]|nr:23S rRNA (pseudouridine(1915)-N(3))-methyltransferase RlmH [Bacteroidales bacterium]